MFHILSPAECFIPVLYFFFFCAKPGSRSSFYLIFGRWIGGGFSFCHICSALVTDAIRLWLNRASGTIVDFVVYNTIFNIGWADLQVFLFVCFSSFFWHIWSEMQSIKVGRNHLWFIISVFYTSNYLELSYFVFLLFFGIFGQRCYPSKEAE